MVQQFVRVDRKGNAVPEEFEPETSLPVTESVLDVKGEGIHLREFTPLRIVSNADIELDMSPSTLGDTAAAKFSGKVLCLLGSVHRRSGEKDPLEPIQN